MKPSTVYAKKPVSSVSGSYTSALSLKSLSSDSVSKVDGNEGYGSDGYGLGIEGMDGSLYNLARSKLKQTLHSPLEEVTDCLARDLSETLRKIKPYGGRKEMLDIYKKTRVMSEIDEAKGNIAMVARRLYPKTSGDARGSVYREMKKFDLFGYRDKKMPGMNQQKRDPYAPVLEPKTVESTLSKSLKNYETTLHPLKYDELSTQIREYSSELASSLSRYVPSKENLAKSWVDQTRDLSWKDSKKYVEKDIILTALQNSGFDKKKAADYLKDDLTTLNNRIKALDLQEELASRREGWVGKDSSMSSSGSPKDGRSSGEALEDTVEQQAPSEDEESESDISILRQRLKEQEEKLKSEKLGSERRSASRGKSRKDRDSRKSIDTYVLPEPAYSVSESDLEQQAV